VSSLSATTVPFQTAFIADLSTRMSGPAA